MSLDFLSFFERIADEHGNQLGRAVAESSFHHFADYNWDPQQGCPSFAKAAPGDAVRKYPGRLNDVKAYARNLALWLAPVSPRGRIRTPRAAALASA